MTDAKIYLPLIKILKKRVRHVREKLNKTEVYLYNINWTVENTAQLY